jgi:hypothetical protein
LDSRRDHVGESIAGTRWKGCETDPFWGESAPGTVAGEIERELRSSGVFREVNPLGSDESLVLETDIRALCSEAIGLFFVRVAGITSLHFRLRQGDAVLFERTIERVVTDADPEYTGSQATFLEQAMKVLISDSLREVLRELLVALDRIAGKQGNRP